MAIILTDEESGLRHAIEKHFGGVSLELIAFDNLLKKAYPKKKATHACPKCDCVELAMEKRTDGNTKCLNCDFEDHHSAFYK